MSDCLPSKMIVFLDTVLACGQVENNSSGSRRHPWRESNGSTSSCFGSVRYDKHVMYGMEKIGLSLTTLTNAAFKEIHGIDSILAEWVIQSSSTARIQQHL